MPDAVLHSLLLLTPTFVLISGATYSIVCWDGPTFRTGVFFFGYGLLLNAVLKLATTHFNAAALTWRPNLCPDKSEFGCDQCGALPARGPALTGKSRLGMPSGHVQLMALITTWCSLKHGSNIHTMCLLWVLTALVALQRVASGCHSILQVGLGAFIGCVLACGVFWFSLEK